MRVTIKGQVTIPQEIRKKLGITPAVEVDFLVKRKGDPKETHKFRKLRGIANVKMTTDEIMGLTRGDK